MKTFKKHLNEKLKNEQFKRLYEEERQLVELSFRILNAREKKGLSQKDVAQKAKVTQQQLSKVENGINCNLKTFLKVCNALDLKLDLGQSRAKQLV
jgi:HTH-type transcriptional regulator / antitoxin HipB